MLNKNMTLGKRMLLGQGLLTGFLVLVGGMGILTVNSLKSSIDTISAMETRKLDLAGTADARWQHRGRKPRHGVERIDG